MCGDNKAPKSKQVSYKEIDEENAAKVESNEDRQQEQGRKRKLKAMEEESASKKVVLIQCDLAFSGSGCLQYLYFSVAQTFNGYLSHDFAKVFSGDKCSGERKSSRS